MSVIYLPLFGDSLSLAYCVWDEQTWNCNEIFSTGCLIYGAIFSMSYWIVVGVTLWVLDGFRSEENNALH